MITLFKSLFKKSVPRPFRDLSKEEYHHLGLFARHDYRRIWKQQKNIIDGKGDKAFNLVYYND